MNNPQGVVAEELVQAKLLRAIYSDRQLEEVMTDFWFNHFNVFVGKGPERLLLTNYEQDVIRPHALGKFEDLLVATAKSPAMLFYLDNWLSVGPNSMQALGIPDRPMRPYGPYGRPRRFPPAESECETQGEQRPQRELRPRIAGTAHAQREWRLLAARRHRGREGLHRMDHREAQRRRRLQVRSAHARARTEICAGTSHQAQGRRRGQGSAAHAGDQPADCAFHFAETGTAFCVRRSAARAGRSHGEDVSRRRKATFAKC